MENAQLSPRIQLQANLPDKPVLACWQLLTREYMKRVQCWIWKTEKNGASGFGRIPDKGQCSRVSKDSRDNLLNGKWILSNVILWSLQKKQWVKPLSVTLQRDVNCKSVYIEVYKQRSMWLQRETPPKMWSKQTNVAAVLAKPKQTWYNENECSHHLLSLTNKVSDRDFYYEWQC
jgi:hypothetical protein